MKSKLKKHVIDVQAYRHNLDEFSKGWLDAFMNATSGADRQAIEILAPTGKAKEVARQIFNEDNADRRDIMSKATRIDHEKSCDEEKIKKSDFTDLLLADGKENFTEDGLIYSLDLIRRLKSPNLSAYGDSPALQIGDRVRVCLNTHIYQGHWGVVIGERRNGEYLIEIRSRFAPAGTGKHFSPEKVYGRMYARAEALTLVEINTVDEAI